METGLRANGCGSTIERAKERNMVRVCDGEGIFVCCVDGKVLFLRVFSLECRYFV